MNYFAVNDPRDGHTQKPIAHAITPFLAKRWDGGIHCRWRGHPRCGLLSQAAPMQRRRCRRRPLGTRPPRRMTRSARIAKISSRHRPASSSTARSVLTAGANSTQKKARTSTQPMIDADLGLGIVFNCCIVDFRELKGQFQALADRHPGILVAS
jgi:hypothetical protein